jgi:type IV pilus assembly protein PilV
LLPKGGAGITGGNDVSYVRVTWAWQASVPRGIANPGEVIDAPLSCGDADVPQGTQCVAIAFSR